METLRLKYIRRIKSLLHKSNRIFSFPFRIDHETMKRQIQFLKQSEFRKQVNSFCQINYFEEIPLQTLETLWTEYSIEENDIDFYYHNKKETYRERKGKRFTGGKRIVVSQKRKAENDKTIFIITLDI